MPRDLVGKLAWASLVLALVTLAALTAINAHLRNEVAPQGIVSFELCAYSGSCGAMRESWGAEARSWAGLSLGLDYLFMLLYAATVFLALRLVADRVPARLRRPTRAIAWAALGAAAADAVENYSLAQLLSRAADGHAWPAAIFATIKFILLGLALAWLVVAWLKRDRAGVWEK